MLGSIARLRSCHFSYDQWVFNDAREYPWHCDQKTDEVNDAVNVGITRPLRDFGQLEELVALEAVQQAVSQAHVE